ncbi:MAG TPA: SDR family oxidoreductase [Candidatus Acidoferrales bacterium]|nr:SDR family oxidoreductase [Candidatus Acidoferrales bacterium]
MGVDVVVVSGASTGIGRACALHLDGLGMHVFAGVRRDEDGASLRAAASERLRPLRLDVTDEQQVERAAEEVTEAVKGARFRGIVNNAGVAVSGPVEFVSLPDWRRQFEVNLFGTISMIQRFLPLLRSNRGRIVNVSSVGGRFPQPLVAPYVASKHAIEAISDVLRVELRPWGIQVALIEPGSVATPIWEKGLREGAAMVSTAPDGLARLYGKAVEVGMRAAQRAAETGVPPERVARAVAHALLSPQPRTRYVVGRDARTMLMLKRLLPDRWRDELILRAGGLPRSADRVKNAG